MPRIMQNLRKLAPTMDQYKSSFLAGKHRGLLERSVRKCWQHAAKMGAAVFENTGCLVPRSKPLLFLHAHTLVSGRCVTEICRECRVTAPRLKREPVACESGGIVCASSVA